MSGSAPKPPDPVAVGKAQTDTNVGTALAQQQLGMTGQTTPTGSINYVKDPTSPSGYRAVTTLSPENQALYNQGQNTKALAVGNVDDTIAKPFDMNAAGATKVTDMQRTFLDPQWQQKEDALQTNLMNRGIRPGSQDYETEMRQFQQQKDDAYNSMYLNAYQTANNDALTQRNVPLNDYSVLNGMPGPAPAVTPAGAPTPGVAATDITTPTYNSYNAQLQASNAQMGGLFGLGSSLLGGWAGSPGGSAAITGALAML